MFSFCCSSPFSFIGQMFPKETSPNPYNLTYDQYALDAYCQFLPYFFPQSINIWQALDICTWSNESFKLRDIRIIVLQIRPEAILSAAAFYGNRPRTEYNKIWCAQLFEFCLRLFILHRINLHRTFQWIITTNSCFISLRYFVGDIITEKALRLPIVIPMMTAAQV